MDSQIKLIADRIKELREILEVEQQEVAKQVGIPLEEYQSYENGEDDIPVGVIYGVATVLGVDPTVLLTGDAPRMTGYTVVRGGKGVSVERYQGYTFSSLAFNYIGREMEPMLVTILPSDEIAPLVTHSGQEFNLCLEGRVRVEIGERSFILEAGDSIYFDPRIPHGQRAVDVPTRFLTVINEQSTAYPNVLPTDREGSARK